MPTAKRLPGQDFRKFNYKRRSETDSFLCGNERRSRQYKYEQDKQEQCKQLFFQQVNSPCFCMRTAFGVVANSLAIFYASYPAGNNF